MKKLFSLMSLTIFIFACEQHHITPEEDYSEYMGQDSIVSEVELMSFEEIIPSISEKPILRLRIRTLEKFECSNYNIGVSKFSNGDDFILRLDSIKKDYSHCLPAFGGAIAAVGLPEGTKKLILINGSSVDKYNLNITGEKVIISAVDTGFTHFQRKIFFRYPENSFVCCANTSANEIYIYTDFLQILTDSLPLTEYFFEGEGDIPYHTDYVDGDLICKTKYFKYENASDFDRAGELLYNYVMANNINQTSSTNILLESWIGNLYWSWTMTK